jgi:hypothetical protein
MRKLTLLTCALLLNSCGPKTLTLPEEPIDRAATCGVVAANNARLATADIKAPLSFEAIGQVLHYPLLAGSTGEEFSSDAATQVQTRMTALQDSIAEGKWQELVPACRAAFQAAYAKDVSLPADRFDARLGCYALDEFVSSSLQVGKYENERAELRDLNTKLDAALGAELRSRVGSDPREQQEARGKALARIAKSGSPVAVLKECTARFG